MGILATIFAGWRSGVASTAAIRPGDEKGMTGAGFIALHASGEAVWMPRGYAAFAQEGYMRNAVVYRCVRMIADATASIPLLLYDGAEEVEDHPLLQLVHRPNALQGGSSFFENWFSHLLVSGNAFVEQVSIGSEPRELHILRPDRMHVIAGDDGWVEGYEYRVAGRNIRFDAQAATSIRPILHQILFHPLNDQIGMSPIEPAATAIDIHNASSAWNKALLDNAARPSGALVYASRDGHLGADQFERLKGELEASFQGARNAGRPLLLEGGLDWKSMAHSPKDMDFIEAKHVAAREIALAFGVPPMLLGIPGDNTYANMREAQRAFWRQTVIPLAERTARDLSSWLAPAWSETLTLRPDLDRIDALSGEREALWERLGRAAFLTVNEQREAVGYSPIDGGDEVSSARSGA